MQIYQAIQCSGGVQGIELLPLYPTKAGLKKAKGLSVAFVRSFGFGVGPQKEAIKSGRLSVSGG